MFTFTAERETGTKRSRLRTLDVKCESWTADGVAADQGKPFLPKQTVKFGQKGLELLVLLKFSFRWKRNFRGIGKMSVAFVGGNLKRWCLDEATQAVFYTGSIVHFPALDIVSNKFSLRYEGFLNPQDVTRC